MLGESSAVSDSLPLSSSGFPIATSLSPSSWSSALEEDEPDSSSSSSSLDSGACLAFCRGALEADCVNFAGPAYST